MGENATVSIFAYDAIPIHPPSGSPRIFYYVISIWVISNYEHSVIYVFVRLLKWLWASIVNSWLVHQESLICVNYCCCRPKIGKHIIQHELWTVSKCIMLCHLRILSVQKPLLLLTNATGIWRLLFTSHVICLIGKLRLGRSPVIFDQTDRILLNSTTTRISEIYVEDFLGISRRALKDIFFRKIILRLSFPHHPAFIQANSCKSPTRSTGALILDWTYIAWGSVVDGLWKYRQLGRKVIAKYHITIDIGWSFPYQMRPYDMFLLLVTIETWFDILYFSKI